MATQLLIYERATPVTVSRHRDWYVKTGASYRFARSVNAVPLMSSEFAAAGAEYALVFAGDERVMPSAILGFRQQENLFVGDGGAWRARYIPAFIRQYPFVLAGGEDDKTLTLCLDEEFEGCNQDGHGERLFDAGGEQTTYLRNVLGFVQSYQADFRRTRTFCDRLKELDLLEPMQARFRLPEGSVGLTGFKAVNRDKLKALSPETLSELARNDGLDLIYAHLHSMRNFDRMVELAREREAEPALTS